MDTKELLKKVRKIEIKTRRLSDHVFGGEYHSTFKGRGMTFSEVRQYQFGDDVRAIDWNVTARYNEPFVKVFEEERELTLMLVVDVSGSEFFGSGQQFKREVLTEIAATLSFSRRGDKLTSCITVKIRYSDFNTHTLQARIPYTAADHILMPRIKELFKRLFERRLLVRLVGVRFSHLVGGGYQMNMFEESQELVWLHEYLADFPRS